MGEKIYEVEFCNYTNAARDTVWNEDDNKYLDVGKEPFLISESDIDYFKKFGNGFRLLKFVGNLCYKRDYPF